MELGYLYVANQRKFIEEAFISVKSIRMFSNLPIALVCTADLITDDVKRFFDVVVESEELNGHIYLAKIIGLKNTPFSKTIFLDCDTFVCATIEPLFELLEVVDIATTIEKSYHTTMRIKDIRFKNIIPEFNTGFIVFRKNSITQKVIQDWWDISLKYELKIDMPGLREAIIQNIDIVKFFVLPEEFNSHGYKSMLMLYGEVKVIHERLGHNWQSTTPFFLSFDKGLQFAKRINKRTDKRLYVPYIGIVPYSWTFYNVLFKIKKAIGVKRLSKNK